MSNIWDDPILKGSSQHANLAQLLTKKHNGQNRLPEMNSRQINQHSTFTTKRIRNLLDQKPNSDMNKTGNQE